MQLQKPLATLPASGGGCVACNVHVFAYRGEIPMTRSPISPRRPMPSGRLPILLASVLASALLLFAGSLAVPDASAAGEPGSGRPDPLNSLMPMPRQLDWRAGVLRLPSEVGVAITGGNTNRLARAVERWREGVRAETGTGLAVSGDAPLLRLIVKEPGRAYPALDTNESYQISVREGGVEIRSTTTYGALHALQTLRQLARPCAGSICIPHVELSDEPRFRWRGYLLDVVRHFMPVSTVKRQLDSMAAVKLNVFHWHLTDDQSFRIESKSLPLLHEKGSDGNYYTQAEIREVIEYAADRGIRVVPELDLPGHSRSWQIAYPELSSAPGKQYELYRSDGIFSDPLHPALESTYELIEKLLAEVSTLFPDEYFHLGGDEVSYSAWEDNDDIVRFMAENDIGDPEALQAYFIQRYAALVIAVGKRPIGWNEVLHPELPGNVALHAWNGTEFPEIANDHAILISTDYYLDRFRSAEFHYRNDPTAVTAGSQRIDEAQILGIEATNWSELTTPINVDICAWPRLAAIAERAWSTAAYTESAEIADVYRRMQDVSERLHRSGSPHKRNRGVEFKALAGEEGSEALETLAEVVIPTPFYLLRRWSVIGRLLVPSLLGSLPNEPFTPEPFTGVLPYESLPSWYFARAVDEFLLAPEDPAKSAILINDLKRWSANHDPLVAVVERVPALQDQQIDRLSQAVKDVADVGLGLVRALRDSRKLESSTIRSYRNTLDKTEVVRLSFERAYLLQFFRPLPLKQHTIEIQPAIVKLLDAYERHLDSPRQAS